MSPSTVALVVPRERTTSMRALLLIRRRVHPANAPSSEIGYRIPVSPVVIEERLGLPGYSAVPMSRVPRSYTPPDLIPPSPIDGRDHFRLRAFLRTRHPVYLQFRGRIPHGPRACAPTLQRLCCHRPCKAYRYRLGRAHPWPDGLSTRWTTCWNFTKSSHPSLLSQTASPGRNKAFELLRYAPAQAPCSSGESSGRGVAVNTDILTGGVHYSR